MPALRRAQGPGRYAARNAGMRAGDSRGRGQKRKGPPSVSLKGREPQAACTDMPWRRERAPRRSPGRTPARAFARKNEEAPSRLGRGPVSDKRLVLTSRGRESVAARRNGAYKKAPHEVYLMGGVNPAATYSPGPEGQVPSAI